MKTPALSMMSAFTGLACAVGFLGAVASADAQVTSVPGMPPVVDPHNIFSETGPSHVAPDVARDLPRVYVPNLRSNDVTVIDQSTFKVVDKFPVGRSPQHVVPSWDLHTL